MAEGSSIVRTERIAGRGILGAFAGLLALTSDAVLVFGQSRLVLIANESAEQLLKSAPGALPGMDIRDLVFSADMERPEDDDEWLPFLLDGTSVCEVRQLSSNKALDVAVRCARVSGTDGAYMVVMRPLDASESFSLERDRMVGELTQANRRLAGTLKIVLDTLGANDLDSLLDHIVRELRDVCEASAVLAYVTDVSELRLMSKTGSIPAGSYASRIPLNSGLARIAQISGSAQRLRVEPEQDTGVVASGSEGASELVAGASPNSATKPSGAAGVRFREIVNEGTRETYRVPARQVPPFANMLLVPVWFGRSMIAAILVGWTTSRHTTTEDARLLDAVCQYLSAQIAGALSALRAKRVDELDKAAQSLHDHLAAVPDVSMHEWKEDLEECISAALGAVVCPIDAAMQVDLPHAGMQTMPLSPELVSSSSHAGAEGVVVRIEAGDAVASWLESLNEPSLGALIVSDEIAGQRGTFLILRDEEEGPLSDIEMDFLRRISSETALLARGVVARGEDRHISQALQLGMRNQLQEVEGITARGVYSSATAAAFVGGDFYDLIRLPDRRACVIMGDVSGKGVEAASVSAAVRTALGAYAWVGLSPAAMVRSLNDFLLGFSRIETFATLFVGVIDLNTAELVYCSAGHPPALLLGSGCELQSLDVRSGMVGAFREMGFSDGRVELHEKDTLLLYTDGVTEARGPEGTFFGEDGLRDAVLRECALDVPRTSDVLIDHLMQDLDEFTGNNLNDDIAMVALRFDEVG